MIGLQKFRHRLPVIREAGFASCLRATGLAVFVAIALSGCVSWYADAPQNGQAMPGAAVAGGVAGVVADGVAAVAADLPTASSVTGQAAGTILYAQTEEGVFILVADHSFPVLRGWGGFGGAADKGETLAETAARETEEETRGYFRRADLLAAIRDKTPVFDRSYAFFFVEVDKVPVEAIANMSTAGKGIAYVERGPFAWVPYEHIEDYLEQKFASARGYVVDERYLPLKGWSTSWFWPAWLGNFKAARTEGAIPWGQPAEGSE